MKNAIGIALAMIIIGAILLGAGFMVAGGELTGFNSKDNHYVEKTYECKDDIDSIRIEETSGSIIVQTGDVDKAYVTYSDKEDESLYEIEESDGRLTVKRKEKKGFHFSFSLIFDFSEHVMTVTVPEDLAGDLDVENTSGSISLKEIGAKSVMVENTSGSITLDHVSSGSDITVNNTSGTISFTEIVAQGNVKADNTSGTIKLDNLSSGEDISLETTSGSIKGTIAGKESDYRITASVVSGSCNLKNTDQGSKKLNTSTTSGSIKIEFAE